MDTWCATTRNLGEPLITGTLTAQDLCHFNLVCRMCDAPPDFYATAAGDMWCRSCYLHMCPESTAPNQYVLAIEPAQRPAKRHRTL